MPSFLEMKMPLSDRRHAVGECGGSPENIHGSTKQSKILYVLLNAESINWRILKILQISRD